MSELETAIHRYQNDPVFHAFVDALVRMLESNQIDRYGMMDAIQVAEMIKFRREVNLSEENLGKYGKIEI